jgi:hypothetical protein
MNGSMTIIDEFINLWSDLTGSVTGILLLASVQPFLAVSKQFASLNAKEVKNKWSINVQGISKDSLHAPSITRGEKYVFKMSFERHNFFFIS